MAEPEFTAPTGTRFTQSQDGKRLYIHLQTYPFTALIVDNLVGKVDYAQFLHDGSEVFAIDSKEGNTWFLLPVIEPDGISPVIEVFLKDN